MNCVIYQSPLHCPIAINSREEQWQQQAQHADDDATTTEAAAAEGQASQMPKDREKDSILLSLFGWLRAARNPPPEADGKFWRDSIIYISFSIVWIGVFSFTEYLSEGV